MSHACCGARANFGRRFHALPQLAVCLRDHGLEVPEWLAAVADYQRDEAQEWCFAQGQDRFAALYHYKSRDFAMGTIAHYRWNEWGYQETVLHLRIGDDPDAAVLDQPSRRDDPVRIWPTILLGRVRAPCPASTSIAGWQCLMFDCAPEQPDFTHAWTPYAAFDEMSVDGDIVTRREGNALALLKGSGPFDRVVRRPDRRQRNAPGRKEERWIVRLSDTARSELRDGDGSEICRTVDRAAPGRHAPRRGSRIWQRAFSHGWTR